MQTYIVERYVAARGGTDLKPMQAKDRQMAERMSATGIPVRYLGAIYMPADEICFSLFEGPSIEVVRQVSDVGGSPYSRIVEAVDMREG